jgi:hypothetical protein
MTPLYAQIEAMASQSAPHIEKFAVTKGWLMEVLRALQRKSVCVHCQELPAYEVPGERTDAPGYAMMERGAIDRMHDMAAATRRPVL